MYNFMITFSNEDLEIASEEFGISEAELRDLLNHMQTESESPRGKAARKRVLKKLTGD